MIGTVAIRQSFDVIMRTTFARALRIVAVLVAVMTFTVPDARGQDRADLVATLLAKWAPHVQSTYGADPEVWRERMANVLAHTDAHNLREALGRSTYESAMAALVGRGSSDPVSAVRGTRPSVPSDAGAFAARLGDISADLTYTPLSPCRIIDTRGMAGGAIPGNSSRNFVALANSFTSQGGSATDCSTSGVVATAVVINVTAVSPMGGGFATVFPFATPPPLTSSVNYAAGSVVNNSVITKIPNPLQAADFTIYTFAQSHFVVDIVGYFAPNVATALECMETADTVLPGMSPRTATLITAPTCPAGFTQTATNCVASSVLGTFPLVKGVTVLRGTVTRCLRRSTPAGRVAECQVGRTKGGRGWTGGLLPPSQRCVAECINEGPTATAVRSSAMKMRPGGLAAAGVAVHFLWRQLSRQFLQVRIHCKAGVAPAYQGASCPGPPPPSARSAASLSVHCSWRPHCSPCCPRWLTRRPRRTSICRVAPA